MGLLQRDLEPGLRSFPNLGTRKFKALWSGNAHAKLVVSENCIGNFGKGAGPGLVGVARGVFWGRSSKTASARSLRHLMYTCLALASRLAHADSHLSQWGSVSLLRNPRETAQQPHKLRRKAPGSTPGAARRHVRSPHGIEHSLPPEFAPRSFQGGLAPVAPENWSNL